MCHETEHNPSHVAWRVCRTTRALGLGLSLSERNLHESHTDSGSEQDKNDPAFGKFRSDVRAWSPEGAHL
jgi:hypothetical protein